MTEHEWLTSKNPRAMLIYLADNRIVSDRQLQLFIEVRKCNVCPLDSSLINNAVYCSVADCNTSQYSCNLLREIVGNPFLEVRGSKDFLLCKQCRGEGKIYHASYLSPAFEDYDMSPMKPIPIELVTCGQCNGKRYLWKPSWLTPKVRDTAQHIYDSNEWDLMPQLGDLLEESGCDNEEILRHCRQEKRCVAKGPYHDGDYCNHGKVTAPNAQFTRQCEGCNGTGWVPKRTPCIRGCWVVDLLLGHN